MSSDWRTSQPPSYSFRLSSYVRVSVRLSYLEYMRILGGYLPVRASGSRPSFIAFCLFCCLCRSFNFQIIVLPPGALLQVVSLCLQLDYQLPQLLGLGLQVLRVHPIKLQGADSDAQGDLLLLLQLLLGLGHLPPHINNIPHPFILLLSLTTTGGPHLLLLGLHHLLPLLLRVLQFLPLLLGLECLLLRLLLPQPLLLLLLLLGQLLLLLRPDLLPLGLLL